MRLRLPHRIFGLAALAGVGVGASAVLAQIEGQDRGVMPIDSGSAYEVSGVTVDVSGKTAEDARLGGWRIAQRKGWAMLAQRLGRIVRQGNQNPEVDIYRYVTENTLTPTSTSL